MSATELIEQLKALSAREREALARLFRELETPTVQTAGNGNGAPASDSGNWPDLGRGASAFTGARWPLTAKP